MRYSLLDPYSFTHIAECGQTVSKPLHPDFHAAILKKFIDINNDSGYNGSPGSHSTELASCLFQNSHYSFLELSKRVIEDLADTANTHSEVFNQMGGDAPSYRDENSTDLY